MLLRLQVVVVVVVLWLRLPFVSKLVPCRQCDGRRGAASFSILRVLFVARTAAA